MISTAATGKVGNIYTPDRNTESIILLLRTIDMAAAIEIPANQALRNRQTTRFTVPASGCYVPAITFFRKDSDELDLSAQAKYFTYLSTTGLKGLVVLGSNAETLLLTREERIALLQCARRSVPPDYPIIAGVMGHSTAQVLEYIKDAYEAGSNYVMVLPCAYFGKQTTPQVVKDFYAQVAAVSPLPIIVYNFPAVCNGLDLDSDIIAEIANKHPNVVGVKLTCGSVAKIARLGAVFAPERFAVFGGQSDFLLGGLAVGSAGCIAAFGNVFPRSIARLYDLWEADKREEALALQRTLALAEAPTKAGIANTKLACAVTAARRAGIKDAEILLRPRRPYSAPGEDTLNKIRAVMLPLTRLEDVPGDVVESRSRL